MAVKVKKAHLIALGGHAPLMATYERSTTSSKVPAQLELPLPAKEAVDSVAEALQLPVEVPLSFLEYLREKSRHTPCPSSPVARETWLLGMSKLYESRDA